MVHSEYSYIEQHLEYPPRWSPTTLVAYEVGLQDYENYQFFHRHYTDHLSKTEWFQGE